MEALDMDITPQSVRDRGKDNLPKEALELLGQKFVNLINKNKFTEVKKQFIQLTDDNKKAIVRLEYQSKDNKDMGVITIPKAGWKKFNKLRMNSPKRDDLFNLLELFAESQSFTSAKAIAMLAGAKS